MFGALEHIKNGLQTVIHSHSIEKKPKYLCHIVKFAARVYGIGTRGKVNPLLGPPSSLVEMI